MDERKLSIGRMAESAYRVFCSAVESLGAGPEPMPDGPGWSAATEFIAAIHDGDYVLGQLALDCARAYNGAAESPCDLPLSQDLSIAWQAVVSHLYVLLHDYDGEESLTEAESRWGDWAADRKADGVAARLTPS